LLTPKGPVLGDKMQRCLRISGWCESDMGLAAISYNAPTSMHVIIKTDPRLPEDDRNGIMTSNGLAML
jgi:hypothetical protein